MHLGLKGLIWIESRKPLCASLKSLELQVDLTQIGVSRGMVRRESLSPVSKSPSTSSSRSIPMRTEESLVMMGTESGYPPGHDGIPERRPPFFPSLSADRPDGPGSSPRAI